MKIINIKNVKKYFTKELIFMKAVERWNGELPSSIGSNGAFTIFEGKK